MHNVKLDTNTYFYSMTFIFEVLLLFSFIMSDNIVLEVYLSFGGLLSSAFCKLVMLIVIDELSQFKKLASL